MMSDREEQRGELRRWENYRRANSEKPSARENELRRMFELARIREGERVWEAGTGNGYLSFPLAQAVGASGFVLTTDVEAGNVHEVEQKNRARRLPLEAVLLPLENPFLGSEHRGSFDVVTSIATFHHFDNRREGTGESGRRQALGAFCGALKPGGRLVLGDVLSGTVTAEYFNAIDNPTYCHPHGHPHDFFDRTQLADAAAAAGFTDVSIEVRSVPWQFKSREEAREFVHTIHNADCSAEESFALAERVLGFRNTPAGFELGWELFFLTARK